MFCWGNTSNGELGLGGIEINDVLSPAEIKDFESINSIKAGKRIVDIGCSLNAKKFFSTPQKLLKHAKKYPNFSDFFLPPFSLCFQSSIKYFHIPITYDTWERPFIT